MSQFVLAKLLTLKVGAAALAVTATGGVAVAAATGTLPGQPGGPSAKPSAHATGKPSRAADHGKGPADAKGSPSPNLAGLCRAYRAGVGDNPGKALENPAFRVLITTAGDEEKVAAYCDTLLAGQKGKPGPSARPGHPGGKPGARPTTGGADGPGTGHKPTSRPAN
jgi:hypothetical protein